MLNLNPKLIWDWCKAWKTWPVLDWIKAAELYRSASFQEARDLYLRGLERHPFHPASSCARLDLAYCYFKLEKFAEAEELLKTVMAQAPSMRECYLRLAHLQSWTGHYLEAAWTLRRAIREIDVDEEIVTHFLFTILDNGGPHYLLKEALRELSRLSSEERSKPRLQLASARLALFRAERSDSSVSSKQSELDKARAELHRLASGADAPFEAVIVYAELLIEEGRIAHARQQLRRALSVAPKHPRVLSLLASSYLKEGAFYNPEYAKQLATSASQNTAWRGPREMHILAEAYIATGDRLGALTIAHKAKDAGSKLLGTYRHVKSLDQLIEKLL